LCVSNDAFNAINDATHPLFAKYARYGALHATFETLWGGENLVDTYFLEEKKSKSLITYLRAK